MIKVKYIKVVAIVKYKFNMASSASQCGVMSTPVGLTSWADVHGFESDHDLDHVSSMCSEWARSAALSGRGAAQCAMLISCRRLCS
jgi:hypothetical protein